MSTRRMNRPKNRFVSYSRRFEKGDRKRVRMIVDTHKRVCRFIRGV